MSPSASVLEATKINEGGCRRMGMQGLNSETCSVVALPKLKVVPDLSVFQQTKAKLCCGTGVRRIPAVRSELQGTVYLSEAGGLRS